MPLSNTAIKNARPTHKTRRIFDSKGLYLEISPKGGKWWRFKYRIFGKEKRISLGTYPEVTLREARERRDDARKLVANDIDPSEWRKSKKNLSLIQSESSFESIAREWFNRQSSSWVPSHANRIIRRLERDIFPWIGTKPVADITAPEVLSPLRRIEQRGAIETSHRALQNCSQIFRYAVATGLIQRDPTSDLKGALSPSTSKHFAAVTEPEKVAEILKAIDSYQGTLTVQCALKLAPLVFVRPGELRHAKWADIDFDKSEWRYRVSKTNVKHIVPLSKQSMNIIREIHPFSGSREYVFPGARTPKRPMSEAAILAALRRMDIGKDELTGHGFRAIARTLLDEVLQFRPDYIEHQLAHSVRDPNGRAYNRTAFLAERHEMMQAWANYLDEIKSDSRLDD